MPDHDTDLETTTVYATSPSALKIAPTDREAVFVLAVNPEAPDMAPLLSPRRLNGHTRPTIAGLLGLGEDTAKEVELINPADLEGVGLAGYLDEGLGLDSAEVSRDAETLDSLRAPVLLVPGSIAVQEERVLPLPRGLTLVGRYGTRERPLGLGLMSARAAATGSLPLPEQGSPLRPRPNRRLMLSLGIFALLAIIAGLWIGFSGA